MENKKGKFALLQQTEVEKGKQQPVKKAIKKLIVLQIANFFVILDAMHTIQLVPFLSLSAMQTSSGQRVWEYHNHVSC